MLDEMNNLPRDREKGSETVWHKVRPWELRGLFVRKYYITWQIDLANKLYDLEKFLDFFLPNVLLKIVLFH